jgi:hypothetical protein
MSNSCTGGVKRTHTFGGERRRKHWKAGDGATNESTIRMVFPGCCWCHDHRQSSPFPRLAAVESIRYPKEGSSKLSRSATQLGLQKKIGTGLVVWSLQIHRRIMRLSHRLQTLITRSRILLSFGLFFQFSEQNTKF